jgi:uncharacterized metal-binding protein YceD (DUF177 family)
MKIEFRKVPTNPKELLINFDSVKIEGSFCRMSQSLVKVDASLQGNTDIQCCRCGESEDILLDEKLDFLLSDGIFKDTDYEDIVIEIENGSIDFHEIIKSELNSIKSDYHICNVCLQDGDDFEKEF